MRSLPEGILRLIKKSGQINGSTGNKLRKETRMANHKSAAKRARQSVKRNELNRARRAKVRTITKTVEKAVEAGDLTTAKTAMVRAESALARAAGRGTLHKKTAARKTSRLAKSLKKAAKA
jgi:small subunit ribosomal protein S20